MIFVSQMSHKVSGLSKNILYKLDNCLFFSIFVNDRFCLNSRGFGVIRSGVGLK